MPQRPTGRTTNWSPYVSRTAKVFTLASQRLYAAAGAVRAARRKL